MRRDEVRVFQGEGTGWVKAQSEHGTFRGKEDPVTLACSGSGEEEEMRLGKKVVPVTVRF